MSDTRIQVREKKGIWTEDTTRITDFFVRVMGEHFHWGYFPDTTLALQEAQDQLIRFLIENGPVGSDSHVLDVGCGVGGTTQFLVDACGCRAIGITNSPVGVEQANQRAASAGLGKRLEYRLSDGIGDDIGSEEFDVVVMIESAYLIPDRQRLFQQAYRVLRGGGVLAILENTVNRALTPQEVFANLRQIIALKNVFGSGKYMSLPGYADLCREVGFSRVATFDISDRVFPTIEHMLIRIASEEPKLTGFDDEIGDFRAAWEYTHSLCTDRVSTYGFVHAVK